MSLSVTNSVPARDAVLFVRIQEVNKTFITKLAKESGFKDTATYLDSLFTAMKGDQNGKSKTSKKDR
jgi:hypothetical protein